jgi:hypothetical protein
MHPSPFNARNAIEIALPLASSSTEEALKTGKVRSKVWPELLGPPIDFFAHLAHLRRSPLVSIRLRMPNLKNSAMGIANQNQALQRFKHREIVH